MKLYKFCRMCIKEHTDTNKFNTNSEFALKYDDLLYELLDRNLIALDKGRCLWRITYQTKFKAKYILSIKEYSTIGGILIFIFTLIQFLSLLFDFI